MSWQNPSEKPISVGIVGAGFAADFHLDSYQRVHGVNFRVGGIASRTESKEEQLAQQ